MRKLDWFFFAVLGILATIQVVPNSRPPLPLPHQGTANPIGGQPEALWSISQSESLSSKRVDASAVDRRLSATEARVQALEAELFELSNGLMASNSSAQDAAITVDDEKQHPNDGADAKGFNRLADYRRAQGAGRPDRQQTDDMQAALLEQLADNPALAQYVDVGEVDCRDTGCRISLTYYSTPSLEGGFYLENELMVALGAAGITNGVQLPDGEGGVETFSLVPETEFERGQR